MGRDTKIIVTTIVATIAIFASGIFLINKSQNKPVATASPDLLVGKDSYIDKADKDEKVVLVEFGDLQCPACASYHPLVVEAKKEFKDSLTYVFRNFPLSNIHKNAKVAAYALEAAGVGGKYWEMQDKLYANQTSWSGLDDPTSVFVGYAKEFGLSEKKFKEDMNSATLKEKVEKDTADGFALKVDSTPTFFINGVKMELVGSYDEFKSVINSAIEKNNKLESEDSDKAYHIHYDLKVYIDGKQIDLSQDKYQSKEGDELDHDTHLHDGNGKVVHVHKEGVTVSQLLKSVKLSTNGKIYVNGKENGAGAEYVPQDLDRIVFIIGSSTTSQIQNMLDSVTNDACIYSLKCPERGTPPAESCVGGLGVPCE